MALNGLLMGSSRYFEVLITNPALVFFSALAVNKQTVTNIFLGL